MSKLRRLSFLVLILVGVTGCKKSEQTTKVNSVEKAKLIGHWQAIYRVFDKNMNGVPDANEQGLWGIDNSYVMQLSDDMVAADTFISADTMLAGQGNWSIVAGDSLKLEGNLNGPLTNKIFSVDDTLLILQAYSSAQQLQFVGYRKL